ncbi:flagellar biosynthetic protein FliQ [Legionella nagasakiensis]|uniref:flagellar biosynthetic protein FliQ n=1 Tax=Legionella nagasakiensis TaxID=535290 RepID=UPI0010555FA1|nr:flagellar biosynthetic protein FliQ [Legionella nagasakiensis]
MSELSILSALQHVLMITMFAVFIITMPTLIVGVVISIIQAATQINEMTITFIPKLMIMFVVLLTLVPWLLEHLVSMTQQFMIDLPNYIR